MPALTASQRSYLEAMEANDINCLSVRSGGSAQCVQRMIRMGLVEYVPDKDWRKATYRITESGRAALSGVHG